MKKFIVGALFFVLVGVSFGIDVGNINSLGSLNGDGSQLTNVQAGDVYLASNNTFSAGTTQTFETVDFTGNVQVGMPTGSDIEIGYNVNTNGGLGVFIGENLKRGVTTQGFDVMIGRDIISSGGYDDALAIGDNVSIAGEALHIGKDITSAYNGNGSTIAVGRGIDLNSARFTSIFGSAGPNIGSYSLLLGGVYCDIGSGSNVGAGYNARTRGAYNVVIGHEANFDEDPNTYGHDFGVAIGQKAQHRGDYANVLGAKSFVLADYANVIGGKMTNATEQTTLLGSNGRTHLIAGSDSDTNSYIKVNKIIFDDTTEQTTAGGGGGGVSDVLKTWSAPQFNLVVSSPLGGPDGLGYSTNSNGQIIYHADADRVDAEYGRVSVQRTPGLSTNLNFVVRCFGAQSNDTFTIDVNEVGGSVVKSAVQTITSEVDIDNLLTVIVTNAVQTAVPEYGRVYIDFTASLDSENTRTGDVSIVEVMILQQAP